jgi:hypothetical protein
LAAVNSAAINMGVQFIDLHFFEYILGSGIGRSYSNSGFTLGATSTVVALIPTCRVIRFLFLLHPLYGFVGHLYFF